MINSISTFAIKIKITMNPINKGRNEYLVEADIV